MDKVKTATLIKNMQDSVREFGSISLQMASKAVAFTATHLTTVTEEMDKYSAKLKTEPKTEQHVEETPKE